MSTITSERLLNIQQWRETYGPGSNVVLPAEEAEELARIALAAQASGTVYQWRERYEEGHFWDDCTKEQYEGFAKRPDVETRILYTAPPAPVSVPDESAVELLATDLMKRIDKITGERHSVATLSSLRVSIVESCRSAMLQGAEPVTTAYKLPEPIKDNRLNSGVEADDYYSGYQAGWNELLEAVSGNSPVIPDGWVLMPIEPTYQMCEAMGLQWESRRFPDRYKAMLAAVKK
ncbi:DUF551 domain-containing protein [Enterobacter hormaechei]